MQTTTQKVKEVINEAITELQGEQHDKILASACIVCLNVLAARIDFNELQREEIQTFLRYYNRGKMDQSTGMPVDFKEAVKFINNIKCY
jgi:hypothetical protein